LHGWPSLLGTDRLPKRSDLLFERSCGVRRFGERARWHGVRLERHLPSGDLQFEP
jgi:hypothetical protein